MRSPKKISRLHSRFTAVAALAVSASVVLAGSVGGASTPDADSGSELITDPSQIEGEITFTTWWAYVDQAVVDGFNELYPNVDVTLEFVAVADFPERIQTLASAGDLPDVFSAQPPFNTALAEAGQLYDLTEALATPGHDGEGVWSETFVDGMLAGANAPTAAAATNGETFSVPFNSITAAGLYNADIFAEVGIEAPETFQDMLDNCQALDAAGYIPMSMTGQVWLDWWPRLAWDQTLGGSDPAAFSVEDPNYIKAFDIVRQMADANCWDDSQVTTDIAGETSLFLQQQTAQFVTVPENFLATVVDGADFEIGSYTIPALDGKEPSRNLGGGGGNTIVVSQSSENKSAAVAFAKYLTSEDLQRQLAQTVFTIPSIDIEVGSSEPIMEAYLNASAGGFIVQTDYMPTFTVEGTTIFRTEILPRLVLGEITPEEAAAATAGLFNE